MKSILLVISILIVFTSCKTSQLIQSEPGISRCDYLVQIRSSNPAAIVNDISNVFGTRVRIELIHEEFNPVFVSQTEIQLSCRNMSNKDFQNLLCRIGACPGIIELSHCKMQTCN